MWLSRLALFEGPIWIEIQTPMDSSGARNPSTSRALCYCILMKMAFFEPHSAPCLLRGCTWSICALNETLKVFRWQQMYCNIFYEGWDCLGRYLLIPFIIDHCLYWAHLVWQECGINSWRNHRPLHSSLLFASSDKWKSNFIYIYSYLKFLIAE